MTMICNMIIYAVKILRFLVSDLTDNSLHVMMKGLIESLDISYEQPTVTYPSTNSSTDVSSINVKEFGAKGVGKTDKMQLIIITEDTSYIFHLELI